MSTSPHTLRTLQRIAVVVTVAVAGAFAWEHISNRDPSAAHRQAAADAFDSGDWVRAYDVFSKIVAEKPGDAAARRGQVNSLVQLRRFADAHRIMSTLIADEPDNGCNYATRGIISDHLARYNQAISDYTRAVRNCRAAVHGMSWFDRLLSNTHEHPPTVSQRLGYLRAQMELPEADRVLSIPGKDALQKPWTS